MSGSIIAGSLFVGTVGYSTLRFANTSTLLLNPLTDLIYKATLKTNNKTKTKLLLACTYFSKPLDRLIQAVVAPIFSVIEHFLHMRDNALQKKHFFFAVRIILTPIAIPVYLIKGIFDSFGLICNTALQLVIPYQTIRAVIKGKEASYQYFELRHILNQSRTSLNILTSPAFTQKPTNSIFDKNGTVITAVTGRYESCSTKQSYKQYTTKKRKLIYL